MHGESLLLSQTDISISHTYQQRRAPVFALIVQDSLDDRRGRST